MYYKRLSGIFFAFAGIIVVGVTGYVFIEKWSLLEALYMTVITISTVGFSEVHPLSKSGRIFTMFDTLRVRSSHILLFPDHGLYCGR